MMKFSDKLSVLEQKFLTAIQQDFEKFVKKYPLVEQLVIDAEKIHGEISVTADFIIGSSAHWDQPNKTIAIHIPGEAKQLFKENFNDVTQLPEGMLLSLYTTIIFELCNATNTLPRPSITQFYSEEIYAMLCERWEYETYIKFKDITNQYPDLRDDQKYPNYENWQSHWRMVNVKNNRLLKGVLLAQDEIASHADIYRDHFIEHKSSRVIKEKDLNDILLSYLKIDLSKGTPELSHLLALIEQFLIQYTEFSKIQEINDLFLAASKALEVDVDENQLMTVIENLEQQLKKVEDISQQLIDHQKPVNSMFPSIWDYFASALYASAAQNFLQGNDNDGTTLLDTIKINSQIKDCFENASRHFCLIYKNLTELKQQVIQRISRAKDALNLYNSIYCKHKYGLTSKFNDLPLSDEQIDVFSKEFAKGLSLKV